jgi:hypothetical protein
MTAKPLSGKSCHRWSKRLEGGHEEIPQQVGVNAIGIPARVVLPEATNLLRKLRLGVRPACSLR